MSRYNKFWVALLGAVAIGLLEYHVPSQAAVTVVALVTALAVYQVPNRVG